MLSLKIRAAMPLTTREYRRNKWPIASLSRWAVRVRRSTSNCSVARAWRLRFGRGVSLNPVLNVSFTAAPGFRYPVISFGGLDNTPAQHSAASRENYVASLREQFGRRLREIRLSQQMSQEEFAELLEISVDFLSLIERGINAPSFENLEVFSKQLRLRVADLFAFER